MLGLGPGFEDFNIGGLFVVVLLYFAEFVIDFEVASRDDLENGVAVVFEIEDVFECLVLGLGVCESFCCQETESISCGFVSPHQDTLSVLKVGLTLVFGHCYL